jgi:alanine racemase
MRSWVEVSLGQIRKNFRAVKTLVGDSIEVMPIVKADAYRHGAVAVSHALEAEGARWLGVSNVHEGFLLRESGVQSRILVMADSLEGAGASLSTHHLTPVIHSLDDLVNVPVPYHLKIDSGMGRLGTRAAPQQIAAAIQAAPARIEGLMTHFASSGNYDSPQTVEQIQHFENVLTGLRAADIHPEYVHSSATIPVAYNRREAWGNLVRPGHAIYGYVSPAKNGPRAALQVSPALTWRVAVLEVKDVEEGALIGYGGIHRAGRRTKIAVLAAGYADGIPHRLGNRGQVIVKGKLAPVIGAVSMDLTTIDVTDCPEIKAGEAVTLLGAEGTVSINAQQMAKWAGTISYAVLCGIHARVKRIYLE